MYGHRLSARCYLRTPHHAGCRSNSIRSMPCFHGEAGVFHTLAPLYGIEAEELKSTLV